MPKTSPSKSQILAAAAILTVASMPAYSATITVADSYLTSFSVAAPETINSALNFPSYLDGPLTGSSTLTTTGYFGSLLYLANNGPGNTFNGNITVDSGTLRLTGSPFGTTTGGFTAPSMTSSSTITVNRAGTLFIDDNVANGYTADRFGTGLSSARPAVNLAGGRIDLNGRNNASSSVQTFGDLTASSGYSIITNTRNTNGNPTLTFDSLSISKGAVINFYSVALGTGTNDARITFTNTPTLTNGILAGAKYWSPGAAGQGEFATYGPNGVAQFTAYDVVSNDINTGTSSTTNFAMTTATTPAALTADRAVNSLNYRANGGTWSLGGFKLTLTSGMFLRNGTNSALTINNGTLTAGNGIDDIDLHIFTAQQNVVIDAVIADNSASAVSLVKSHGNTLTVSGGANNTYTGGTYVVDGTLVTGSVANRRYLGTGAVTVDNGFLQLGTVGATSNSTGDDYTAVNGGRIQIASGAAGAYTSADTFNIGANSIIYGASASGQGLASLTRGTNITLAEDAIISHGQQTGALNLATGTIQNLGTNPDLYYGLQTDQNSATGSITIGSGTAFKGISTDRGVGGKAWQQGTINIASGTTSVNFQGTATYGTASVLTLGNGATAGNPVVNFLGTGTVDINALGTLTVSDPNGVYGDTSLNRNVRFVAKAGSTLNFSSGAGMGSGTGIASALVQNGGTLGIAASNSLNGAVTVGAGGRLVANQAGGLTGTGAITFNEGSILEITNATGFSGTQATAASIAAGTIVRVAVNNPGTAGETLDSFFASKSPIYQLTGSDVDVPEPASPGTTTMTLNKNGSGVGGILTNGLASTFFRNNVNGQITIGANGGVMAATSGTELQVQETIVGTGVTLTIGTTAIIDGAPKLGSVALGSAAGSNTYTGQTIINAGTLRAGYADVLGATSNQLTVNTGGTLSMTAGNQTIGNLTGTGGIINTAGRTLTIGQGDTGGGNYQGSIQGAGGALTKTGTGTITLSGTNTYTGATAVNAGTLLVNGSLAAGSAVTVGSTATLGGTGTVGGTTNVNTGGTLSPGNSPGTITFTGNLNVNNGSSYLFEAGDLTDVDGTLDLNDNWTLVLSGTGFQNGGSVVLFTYGTLAATPDLVPTYSFVGLGFTPGALSLTTSGGEVVLNGISVVPEPTTLGLLAMGAVGLMRRRRVA